MNISDAGAVDAAFGSVSAVTFVGAASGLFIHDHGNRFIFPILAASASYIAVPAAMRLAAPKADPGLYIPMALGITFPFNITLGMPVYYLIMMNSFT